MSNVSCSFIGHRKIEITNELKEKVYSVIEDLIINKGVNLFLFGSRSQFNDFCHMIVSKLKEKYKNVKRVCYTCKSEVCVLEKSRKELDKKCSNLFNSEIHFLGYEEEYEHKTKYSSYKGYYVERNQAMIKNSYYCVFYYNEAYKPKLRKRSKKDFFEYQPKSGTKLAYEYAKKNNKVIINVFSY